MKSKSKNYKIWFNSEKSLESIAKTFSEKELIGEFEYGFENVYEWIETQLYDSSFELKISRKHCYSQEFEESSKEQLNANLKEPIRVMLMYNENEPSDDEIEKIANQINLILTCSVWLGTVIYLGGDDYEYIKMKEIPHNKV